AIVLPFPKPGKDPAIPSNYRPIALTSCLCKLLERMVNARLMWFLETNKILSPHQCGFRRHRSSIDHLLRLETSIREAFVRRQHLVSVFFDLEKAYDRAWRYGILRDLHGCGLRGNLPLFIEGFLQNRRFRVRVGSTLSSYFPQEEGVPQGSVLSVTLFILRINDIFRQLPLTVRATGFVDDLQIFCSSVNMGLAERQLQSAISKLSSWTLHNGFVFSSQKTVCVHFCRKRGLHPDPSLRLGPSSIRV
ncbi:reverse transcriptase family protein, partial [Salmonella enterica subsp. enterica serovar Derby]|nr:reverse transcriptase family protein [Salmonella enterica subsp. enterica serovar Derby]